MTPNTAVPEIAGQAQIGILDNYPNPAQTSTNIRFSCSGGHVKIRLFRYYRKEIATLAEGMYDKGSHEVNVDVNSCAMALITTRVQSGSNHFDEDDGCGEIVNWSMVIGAISQGHLGITSVMLSGAEA